MKFRECSLMFPGSKSTLLHASKRHESQGVYSDFPGNKEYIYASCEPPRKLGSVLWCFREQTTHFCMPRTAERVMECGWMFQAPKTKHAPCGKHRLRHTHTHTHTRYVTLSENSSASNNRWHHEQQHSARYAGVCVWVCVCLFGVGGGGFVNRGSGPDA
jgi:hypothetical protein